MKKNILRIIFLILIILNSSIIFGFSSQNGEESGNLSKMVITKIADILKVKEENRTYFLSLGEKVIRKLAHFSIYTLLGIWSFAFIYTFNLKQKYKTIITAIWGFLYASTDEFHQMFSKGRTASINDVIIDTLGVIFGLLLVLLILKIKEMLRINNTKNKEINLNKV